MSSTANYLSLLWSPYTTNYGRLPDQINSRMGSLIDTAISTRIQVPGQEHGSSASASISGLNGAVKENGSASLEQQRVHVKRKYKHVAAVHSVSHTSCLSEDSKEHPSFVGFRNLMVLVLGKLLRNQSRT